MNDFSYDHLPPPPTFETAPQGVALGEVGPIGTFTGVVLALCFGPLTYSFAIYQLWNWFLAPAGLPEITYGTVFAAFATFSLLMNLVRGFRGSDGEKEIQSLGNLLEPLVLIVLGFVILSFGG